MKLILTTLYLLTAVITASFGQILKPVQWNFSSKKLDEKTYEIHLTASIGPGWHIYSQFTPKGGPVPTTVTFNKNAAVLSLGKPQEVGKLQQKMEKAFNMEVKYFADKVDFVQVVKVKTQTPQSFSGTIEFMVCNEKQCLPPKEEDFALTLK